MSFDAAAICSIFAMMPAYAFRDAARLFIFFALMPIAAIFLLSFDDSAATPMPLRCLLRSPLSFSCQLIIDCSLSFAFLRL